MNKEEIPFNLWSKQRIEKGWKNARADTKDIQMTKGLSGYRLSFPGCLSEDIYGKLRGQQALKNCRQLSKKFTNVKSLIVKSFMFISGISKSKSGDEI